MASINDIVGEGRVQAGGARPLAPAVAGMVRPSLRGHTGAAAHLWDPLDEVSCSAPCRLVGSTASCAALAGQPAHEVGAHLLRELGETLPRDPTPNSRTPPPP